MSLYDINQFEYEEVDGGYVITDIKDDLRNCDIELPEGVKVIDSYSFSECKARSITLPSSLELIDSSAFSDCPHLESVIFHTNSRLKRIEDSAFENAKKLGSIQLPTSVEYIGIDAFAGCKYLKRVNFSELTSLREIEDGAFSHTGIEGIVLPNGIKRVGFEAFSGCSSLTHVGIPSKVAEMDMDVFSECQNLQYVYIAHDEIPNEWDEDFLGCEAQIKLVGENCDKYTPLYLLKTSPLDENPNLLILLGPIEHNSIEELILHPSISIIDYSAFSGDDRLKRLKTEKTLGSICRYAFQGCRNLHDIEIANPRTFIDFCAFDDSGVRHAYINDYITSAVYSHTKELEAFSALPGAELTRIAKSTFSYTGIKDVKIPDTVQCIESLAFSCCRQMKSLELGNVSQIESEAFSYCDSLADIKFPTNAVYVENMAFSYCFAISDVDLGGANRIGMGAFAHCKNLREVVVPEKCYIDELAFQECPIERIVFKSMTYAEVESHGLSRWLPTVNQKDYQGTMKIVCKDKTVTMTKYKNGSWH